MKNKNLFDGYKKQGTDKKTEENLESIFKDKKLSSLDACKLCPVFARRQWLKRFLAHYELFKQYYPEVEELRLLQNVEI